MSYRTHWERQGFVVQHRGTLNSSDALETRHDFYSDERSDYARYQIIDFSHARAGELVDDDFIMACALDIGGSTYLQHLLVAFVVSNLEILTQTLNYIDRMKAAGCNWSFRVFTDLEEARSWIRLELGHH